MQCLQSDWIPGPITLLATALPAELMEIATNTVSRGDYEPITVPITLVQQDLSHCKPQLSYWRSPVTQLAEVITNLLQFLLH
jgi:hypothetical protein